jgi:hypothetical protein
MPLIEIPIPGRGGGEIPSFSTRQNGSPCVSCSPSAKENSKRKARVKERRGGIKMKGSVKEGRKKIEKCREIRKQTQVELFV